MERRNFITTMVGVAGLAGVAGAELLKDGKGNLLNLDYQTGKSAPSLAGNSGIYSDGKLDLVPFESYVWQRGENFQQIKDLSSIDFEEGDVVWLNSNIYNHGRS